jgi:hypothetical protein
MGFEMAIQDGCFLEAAGSGEDGGRSFDPLRRTHHRARASRGLRGGLRQTNYHAVSLADAIRRLLPDADVTAVQGTGVLPPKPVDTTSAASRSRPSATSRVPARRNPRGNRQLNHAIHMIAVIQGSQRHPRSRHYRRKQAEGHGRKEAMRALKPRISDAVYRQLVIDSR